MDTQMKAIPPPIRRLRPLLAMGLALPGLMAQDASDWQIHGQATTVTQTHGGFTSPYAGDNSLLSRQETATSFTGTLMTGFRLWKGGEFYLDGEGAAGKGVSSVLGMAGAPNGETYRVGNPAFRASVVRAFFRQTWDLGGDAQKVEDDAHQLAGIRSSRRIVVHVGKLSVMDLFDNNAYSHDPRTQFLNWTLMGHGAWDYPADTRGYTWGYATEFYWDAWAARYARFAEPLEANQLELDHGFARAHGDVVEVEHDHALGDLPGAVRVMVYRNTARMGDYREALALSPVNPEITATGAYGRVKRGWGINAEQALTQDLGAFARWSWNDGKTETWAFTEVDRSITAGLSLKGTAWGRPKDRFGLAFIQNGLASEHREYLAAGGQGFIIGDGRLSYAPERILETTYALAVGKHVTASLDLQHCWNPAYNTDRGPVTLYALRLHAQF
jgi:hypothetical protein